MSNERRLKKENRDWAIEYEYHRDALRASTIKSIAVRRWRDGTDRQKQVDVKCSTDHALIERLKSLAIWGAQFKSRIHFEWVWAEDRLYVVQLDPADSNDGFNPRQTLRIPIFDIPNISLEAFRAANDEDFSNYRKLHNAKVYMDLGYEMPKFYVLDTECVAGVMQSGELSAELTSDLLALTQRPLILRTDGASIPKSVQEMLPRSDELRSIEDARIWILKTFIPEINKPTLRNQRLCLIAHHFIPAVSSAWAGGFPDRSVVRVESLWGIPEGLYYFAHDTFNVETRQRIFRKTDTYKPKQYGIKRRLRYKGIFIYSDETGRWVPRTPIQPYEWSASIKKDEWIKEIAYQTRQIALHENKPVSVMWLVETHPKASPHRVLPWYHSGNVASDEPKAAPLKKRSFDREFRIESLEQWDEFKVRVRSERIERLILFPTDTRLIRNRDFAKEVAGLSKEFGFVVILAGGVLSHVYYALTSQGASVECQDLFGGDEDVMEFDKLVRDRIPKIIDQRGEHAIVVPLTGEALVHALKQKLVEEAFEALDAKPEDLLGELADLTEVCIALVNAMGVKFSDLTQERKEKRRRRGGFDKGLLLRRTTTQVGIIADSNSREDASLAVLFSDVADAISVEEDIGHPIGLRRVDHRTLEGSEEDLLTYEWFVNRDASHTEEILFEIPNDTFGNQLVTITIEGSRRGATLRERVHVALHPVQLNLNLE